ncbi:MAG: threonyl-tRNA synthetase editing domain-containing protein [Candidatus Diapherotrites archaeon]
MKVLMWHCKEFEAALVGESDMPETVIPEKKRMETEKMGNCIVAMVTVEKKDVPSASSKKCVAEIKKFAADTKSANIVVMPFVHLSNKIADSGQALKTVELIEGALAADFNVLRSHFGHHKELLLHTFGHKVNVRYREL